MGGCCKNGSDSRSHYDTPFFVESSADQGDCGEAISLPPVCGTGAATAIAGGGVRRSAARRATVASVIATATGRERRISSPATPATPADKAHHAPHRLQQRKADDDGHTNPLNPVVECDYTQTKGVETHDVGGFFFNNALSLPGVRSAWYCSKGRRKAQPARNSEQP